MSIQSLQSKPELFRANMQMQFGKIMGCEIIGKNIEMGVYNYTIQESIKREMIKKWKNPLFCEIYVNRLRTIFNNLETNAELREQLTTGTISSTDFAFITHQEMKPKLWHALIEKQSKRVKSQFTIHMEASTDMFTCKKCKSKRCTFYELQTRSADEAATIFITCLDCGKNWKN